MLLKLKQVLLLSITLLMMHSLAAFSEESEEDDIKFSVKPSRCIALHEGQECYQRLSFSWQTSQPGTYCLIQENQAKPLHCWNNSESDRYRFELKSKHKTTFYIVNTQKRSLAKVDVKVSWVYKKSKSKRSENWRVF